MPGNKKPKRKGYIQGRRHVAASNAIEIGISRAARVSKENQQELTGPSEEAYKAMCRGELTRDGWQELAHSLNIAEGLCGLLIGNNLKPQIMLGQDALLKAGQRLREDGRVTMWGLEIGLIREALDYYTIQLGLCSNGELNKAIQRAARSLDFSHTKTVVNQKGSNTRPTEV